MRRLFPFIQWLPELKKREVLRADLVAGLTVAMVVIPQSMANARLAQLPPVYGLYAAFLPPVIAAFFGSSRQLSTGPVALSSLISAAAVQMIIAPGTEDFIAYSIALALMVGVMRIAMGLLRMGTLVNLLSSPVIVGFTNAAALIIATSQLPNVFGVSVARGNYHFQTMWHFAQAVPAGFHWQTLGMAGLTFCSMLGLRYKNRKLPYVLIAAGLATLVAWVVDYQGEVVGEIPPGLPAFAFPAIEVGKLSRLAAGAITLTFVGFMEAISIAKTIATQTKQRIDVDRELIGQGMASLVGSFFHSYVVSGSFARSAVNFASGAVTGFSSVVTSLVVMATLLWLTPLFYYLPQATLGVIIIVAVANLFRIKPLVTAWRVNPQDGFVGIATFVGTLALAPDLHEGIFIGVFLSLSLYLYRSMRPRVAFLARHLDGTLRDADVYGLKLDPHIALIRFDDRLYFGNSSFFEDQILEAVARFPELKFLIIDAGGINQIDATGQQTVRNLVENLHQIGVELFFTRAKKQFTDALERSGCMELVGRDHFFSWNQHALEHVWAKLGPAYKAHSPLNMPHPLEDRGSADEYHSPTKL